MRVLVSLVALGLAPFVAHPAFARPLVIGHRGACGYRPEHTLASYELAIEQGADFIEPDLVVTKDGVLIARHEPEISGTTDVAEKFPSRKAKKSVDGQDVEGWFAEDFTLAEIRTLRAKERLPSRDHSYDGKFPVPTFDEIIALVKKRSRELRREIGIYPETKHPTYFRDAGLPLEPRLIATLKREKWTKANAPVIVQSFELGSLHLLRHAVGVRLVFLYDESARVPFDFVKSGDKRTYGDLLSATELSSLGKWLFGIGPWKRQILPEKDGVLQPPTSVVADAHAGGLKVHPYTFRSGAPHLAKEYEGDPAREYAQFFKLGVDGVFTDFPKDAIKAWGK